MDYNTQSNNTQNRGYFDICSFEMEGNLTKPVEVRTNAQGQAYGYITVAVSKGLDAQGQKRTQFFEVAANGNVALAAQTLQKGAALHISGTLNWIPGQDTGTVVNGKKVYTEARITATANKISTRVFAPKTQAAPATQVPAAAPQMPGTWEAYSAMQSASVPQAAPQAAPQQMAMPAAAPAPQAAPAMMPQAAPAPQAPAAAGWQPQATPAFAGNFGGTLPFGNVPQTA